MSFIHVYRTAKQVEVKAKALKTVYLLMHVALGIAVLIFIVVGKKYQRSEFGRSSTIVKVSGAAETKTGIWDSIELRRPPEENDDIFVTTNALITEQQRGTCGESPTVAGANCTENSQCPNHHFFPDGHGFTTGVCTNDTGVQNLTTCEIQAWCPVENSRTPEDWTVSNETENINITIKNYVYFIGHDKFLSNFDSQIGKYFLQHCMYDKDSSKTCPVFRLGDIVSYASPGKSPEDAYKEMALEGGIIQIDIKWDCNLDWDSTINACKPELDFKRLDNARHQSLATGYNFHYTDTTGVKDSRKLIKVYGILLAIEVEAKGGKLDKWRIFTSIGSYFGLFTGIEIACELLLLYFCQCRFCLCCSKRCKCWIGMCSTMNSCSGNKFPAISCQRIQHHRYVNDCPKSIYCWDDRPGIFIQNLFKVCRDYLRSKRSSDGTSKCQRCGQSCRRGCRKRCCRCCCGNCSRNVAGGCIYKVLAVLRGCFEKLCSFRIGTRQVVINAKYEPLIILPVHDEEVDWGAWDLLNDGGDVNSDDAEKLPLLERQKRKQASYRTRDEQITINI